MDKRSICYLFGAGEYYIDSVNLKSADLIVAVDGGLLWLKERSIVPNLIVGDFDSISEGSVPPYTLEAPGQQHNADIITLSAEKDDTDMAAALSEAWERGCRIFHIFGGTGGRLDHTIANIQLLADIAVKGGRCYLFDRNTVVTAIHNDRITFPATASGTLSVFSHTDISTGVYENGLMYPLTDATLHNTTPLGVSNEFAGLQGSVSVESGTLIIFLPKDIKLNELAYELK